MTAVLPGTIEAHALTRRYGGLPVLDNVTFTLPASSRTALVGPNGAGKSTLLALLSALAAPSAGSGAIGGRPLGDPAARRMVGVMGHHPMLYEELTPLENLRFFARLYGVSGAEERIETLLRTVGLWHRRHEQTAVLSRGYHQRLALARAVVHGPSVLLLDEPETGLDTEGIALLDALALCAPGVTVLAATHRLDRIDAWANGRLELRHGRLLAPSPTGDARAVSAPPRAAHAP